MVIGEYPGKAESRSGRPFVGRTGKELDRVLDGCSLPRRGDCYVTNFIKEWGGDDYDYVQADFDRDEPELIHEIRTVRPAVILALGRHITRWFLGDVDLDETFAIPWRLPQDSPRRGLFEKPDDVSVLAAYNPAAGFRSPDISARIAYQFTQFEAFWKGELSARHLYADAISAPSYYELGRVVDVDRIMAAGGHIATDTEGYPHAPWSVQGTSLSGVAWIIRYCHRVLIDRFAEWVNTCPELFDFTFHNALHDLAMFRAFGVDTTRLRFDDTMIQAYNLQLEPQGLKPLCARFCGMQMSHYDEIMGDADRRLAQQWLLMALENEDHEYQERCEGAFLLATTTPFIDKRGKTQPGRKLRSVPKLPKTDLHKSVERCLRSKNPRKLWTDQVLDRHIDARPTYGTIWHATLDHVPLDRALAYAGRDADGTHRLRPQLEERLRANALWDTYLADLGTVPLIDRMQQVGIKPDLAHFAQLSRDLDTELVDIQSRLLVRIGGSGVQAPASFNPNSTYHVGELLFGAFKIDSLRWTSTDLPSTNDKVLEALERDQALSRAVRDIISDIRYYRETYKLKHTFVDQIPEFTNRWPYDGRIHATFRITRTVSGRLAASDPNLLAMPKYGKFATRFREGFVSRDGAVLASWDLSQIELRVLAHLSQDPVLLAAFRTGQDLHAKLAQRIFGGREDDYAKGQGRLAAKAVNFGIPMGMTCVGLCLELRKNGVDVDEDDAQKWLDETMRLYARVPEYQQGKIAEARRYGYVTDIRGRRRYIGGTHSFDDATRSEAERFAFSTPIQAGAQEIMKEAEAYVYTDILLPHWTAGHYVEPLIQIHDDLLLEVDEAHVLQLDREMRHAMTQVPAHWLSVPIETSGDYGKNWGSMKEIGS